MKRKEGGIFKPWFFPCAIVAGALLAGACSSRATVIAKKLPGQISFPAAPTATPGSPRAPWIALVSPPTGRSPWSRLESEVSLRDADKFAFAWVLGGATDCPEAKYGEWLNAGKTLSLELGEDGPKALCLRVADTAELATAFAFYSWHKDTEAPTLSLDGLPAPLSSTATISVTPRGEGLVSYRWLLGTPSEDCSASTLAAKNWISASVPLEATLAQDGALRLCVQGRDEAGNESQIRQHDWVRDSTPPQSLVFSGGPANGNSGQDIEVTLGNAPGSDAVEYQYALVANPDAQGCAGANFGIWRPISQKIAEHVTGAGMRTLCVRGRDAARNEQSVPSSLAWTQADAAQEQAGFALLEGAPAAATVSNSGTLTYTVSGPNIASYRHAIVAGGVCPAYSALFPSSSLATPITASLETFSGLTSLCVWGVTPGGMWQQQATRATFSRDATAPEASTVVVSPGLPSGIDTQLSLTVAGTDVHEYRYVMRNAANCSGAGAALAGAAWRTTAVPLQETLSGEGFRSLCLQVRDLAGNVTGIGDGDFMAGKTHLTWEQHEVSSALAAIPTGPSPVTTLSLDFNVQPASAASAALYALVSGAGNCSSTPYTEVALGAGPEVAALSLGSDGAKLLCVRGKLSNGRVQEIPTIYSWTKDAAAPFASIAGLPASRMLTTNAASLSLVQFGDTSLFRFLTLPGPTPAACSGAVYSGTGTNPNSSSAIPLSALADGNQRLCVELKDAAQNVTHLTVDFEVDANAPTPASVSLSPTSVSGYEEQLTVSVGGNDLDVAEYRYVLLQASNCNGAAAALAGATWRPKTIPISEPLSGQGNRSLCLQVRDRAQNTLSPLDANFVAGKTAISWMQHEVTSAAPGIPTTNSAATTLALDVGVQPSGGASAALYALLSPTESCATATYTEVALKTGAEVAALPLGADGPKVLCLKGKLLNGRVQQNPTIYTWLKDSTAPYAAISGIPAMATTASLSPSLTHFGDTVSFRFVTISGATPPACSAASYSGSGTHPGTTPTLSLTGLSDGKQRLCVELKDAAENTAHLTYDFEVDATTPAAASVSLTPATLTGHDAQISVSVSGADTDVWEYRFVYLASSSCNGAGASLSGALWRPKSVPISLVTAGTGARSLCLQVRDKAGNTLSATDGNFVAGKTSLSWTQEEVGSVATGVPMGSSSATSLSVDFSVTPTGSAAAVLYALVADSGGCESATYTEVTLGAGNEIENLALGPDGVKLLCVRGKLTNGRIQEMPTTYAWVKNTTTPVATVTGLPASGYLTSSGTTLTLTGFGDTNAFRFVTIAGATPAACSGATYAGGGTDPSVSPTIALAGLTDGEVRLCVELKTAALTTTYLTYDFRVDTAAPLPAQVTLTPNSVTGYDTQLNVSVAGTDANVYEYRYVLLAAANCNASGAQLAAASWRSKSVAINENVTGTGARSLCLQVRDRAGNAMATADANFVAGNTALSWTQQDVTSTVSGVPTGSSSLLSVNLDFSVNPAAAASGALYALVSGSGGCESATYTEVSLGAGNEVSNLALGADGAKILCVKGKLSNNRVQEIPTVYTWLKDTLLPFAAVSGLPASGILTANSAALSLASFGDVSSFRFTTIAGATPGACSSATYSGGGTNPNVSALLGLTGLSDGDQRLCVELKDAAQNASYLTYDFDVDATAPLPAQVSLSPSTFAGHDGDLTVTVAGTDLDVADYRFVLLSAANCNGAGAALGGATWRPKSVPIALALAGTGPRSLCVQVRDRAGNLMSTADASFIAGKTALSWTQSEVTSSVAGMPSGSSASATLALDFAVNPSAAASAALYALISGAGGCESASYTEVALGAGAEVPALALGADGPKLLCVRGKLNNGRIQEAATTYAWQKDTQAPFASVSGLPASGILTTNGATLTLVSYGDTSSFRFATLAGATPAACSAATYSGGGTNPNTSATLTLAALADGDQRLCVELKDAAQNTTYLTFDFDVDTALPLPAQVTLTPATLTGTEDRISVAVSGADTDVFEYRYVMLAAANCNGAGTQLAGATWRPKSVPIGETVTGAGNRALCLQVRDKAGNAMSTADASFVAGKTALTWSQVAMATTVTGVPSGFSNATSLNLDFSVTPAGQGKSVLYALLSGAGSCDSATYTEVTLGAGNDLTNLAVGADGSKLLCLRGKLQSDRVQESPSTFNWVKDTVPPFAAVVGVPQVLNANSIALMLASYGDTALFRFVTIAGAAPGACSLATYSGGGTNPATSSTLNLTALTDGDQRLCVELKDAALNVAYLTYDFDVNTQPLMSVVSAASANPTGPSQNTSFTVTISGYDATGFKYGYKAGTDCTGVTYSAMHSAATPIVVNGASLPDTDQAQETYSLCVKAVNSSDTLSQATPTRVTWQHDTLAPPASSVSFTAHLPANGAVLNATQLTLPAGKPLQFAGVNDTGSTFSKFKWKLVTVPESAAAASPAEICNSGRTPAAQSLATWVSKDTDTAGATLAAENGLAVFCACIADGVGNSVPGCRDLAAPSDVLSTSSWMTTSFRIDVTPPTIQAFALRDQSSGSSSWTNDPNVTAVFTLSETIAALCVTKTATPPAAGDGCWNAAPGSYRNVTGGAAAKTISINLDSAAFFNGALAAQVAGTDRSSYTVYGWAKDTAGNMTTTGVPASIIYDKPTVGSDWTEFAPGSGNGLFLASNLKLNIVGDINPGAGYWLYVNPRGHMSVRFPTAGLNNTSGSGDNPDGFTRMRIYACHPSNPSSTAACETRTLCTTWTEQDCVKLVSDDPDFSFNPSWGHQAVVDVGGLPDDKVTFFNVRPATASFEHQNNFWFGTQTGSDLTKRAAHESAYGRPNYSGFWTDFDKHQAHTMSAPTLPASVDLTSNTSLSNALNSLSAVYDYLASWAGDTGIGQGTLGILAGPVRSGDGDHVRFRSRVVGERVYTNENKASAKQYAPLANLYRPEGLALALANLPAVNAAGNAVAADVKDGTLYVADTEKHRILRVDLATGLFETYAGTGAYGYNGDGLHRTQTRFYNPKGLSLDKQGNLFVADSMNNRLRRIDRATGLVSTVMGNGKPFTNANAIAVGPECFVTNISGDSPDQGDEVQWRKWWTAAGCPASMPEGVFVLDTTDDGTPARRTYELYVAETGAHCIHRVKQIGGVWKKRLVAGSCWEAEEGYNFHRSGGYLGWASTTNSRPLRDAVVRFPESVVAEVDATGNNRTVYVADTPNHIIFKVDLDATLLGDTDIDGAVANPYKATWLAGRRGNSEAPWRDWSNNPEAREFSNKPYLFPRSFLPWPESSYNRAGFYEGYGGDTTDDNYAPRLYDPTGLVLLPGDVHTGTGAEARYGRLLWADRMSHRIRILLQMESGGVPDASKNYRNVAPRIAGGQHTSTGFATAWHDGTGYFSGFVDGSNNHYRYNKECENGDRLTYHWSYLDPANYRNPGRGSYKDDNGGTKHRWASCWNQPSAMVASSDGSTLYVADKMNNLIRKVKVNWANHDIDDATNEVVTIMGSTRATQSGNRAVFDGGNWGARSPGDGAPGALWSTTPFYHCGANNNSDTCWGASYHQTFANPRGIAVDATRGLIFVADRDNNRVVMLRNNGGWDAKTILSGNYRDGVNRPSDVAYNPATRQLFVTDTGNHRVLRLTIDDDVNPGNGNEYTINRGRTVLIGEGDNTDRNMATGWGCAGANLKYPEGIDVDPWGNLIIADTGNNRVVRVILDSGGNCAAGINFEHVAGDPAATSTVPSGDGPNPPARRLLVPVDVVASGRDIYVSERNGHRIRKISGAADAGGGYGQRNWSYASIGTVVGTGIAGFSPDGTPAGEAQIDAPHGMFLDPKGILYFADTFNHAIRKVENGKIATVVGQGIAGDEGLTGSPTSARLFLPWGVAINHRGHLVFTDMNHMVKMVPLNSRATR